MWYREYRSIAPCDSAKIILIDNLAISGPKGKKMIQTFDRIPENMEVVYYAPGSDKDASKIYKLKGKDLDEIISIVPGKTGQGNAMRVVCNMGRTEITFKDLNMDVNLTKEYNRIDMDYSYLSDVSEFLRPPFKFKVNGMTSRSMYVDRQQGGVLTKAETESKGNDQYGICSYDGVYTYDSQWTRKSLLTAEGYLIVVDEYIPGAAAEGMIGGPVWQLMNPPEAGPSWFDAVAGMHKDKKLLVYFHPDRKNKYAVQCQFKILGLPDFYATYAQTRFVANMPARFISVLIPHDASIPPEKVLNKTVRNNVVADRTPGVNTQLSPEGDAFISLYSVKTKQNINIELKSDGGWSVKRND